MTDNLRDRLPQGPNVNDQLGIKVTELSPDKVVMQVEVGPKVHQPYGILHGGVSALMAEGGLRLAGPSVLDPIRLSLVPN